MALEAHNLHPQEAPSAPESTSLNNFYLYMPKGMYTEFPSEEKQAICKTVSDVIQKTGFNIEAYQHIVDKHQSLTGQLIAVRKGGGSAREQQEALPDAAQLLSSLMALTRERDKMLYPLFTEVAARGATVTPPFTEDTLRR